MITEPWYKILRDNVKLVDGDSYEDLYSLVKATQRGKMTDFLLSLGIDLSRKFVEYIPEGTFFSTMIDRFEIFPAVTKIKELSFARCPKLTEVILPEKLDYIGNGAFYLCNNLNQLNYPGTMEDWKNIEAEFHFNWNNGSSIKKIVCSDGEIEL